MRGRILLGLFYTFVLFILMPRQSLTQGSGDCPDLVLQALEDLGDNCGDMGRNTACYGFNHVSALFSADIADTFFTQPSDRSDLNIMQSIQTAPLDTVLNQWGVAVMNVQANIPNTLPGQSARFLLLGDVSISNDVPAEESSQAAVESVTVVTSAGANIRSAPTARANVVASVPAGTSLPADALSGDGNWLRVTYSDSSIGWMSREVVQANDVLSSLPLITETHRTPMQAFHFHTGIGQTTCDTAPSLLMVQGPENLQVEITANGADIQIGSTIVLMTGQNTLKLITLSGKAKVGNLVVPAGYSADAPITGDDEHVSGGFGGLHVLTQDELDRLKVLEQLPADVLNYTFKLPDVQNIQQTQNGISVPAAGQANCQPFRPTSPLDGLAFGVNTFYWDAAPGATSYRVTVSGVGSVEVNAPTTNAFLDLSSAGFNPQMSWYVEALVNGKTACVSNAVTIAREAPPVVAGGGGFNVSWTCSGPPNLLISYSNLPAGTTDVTISFSYAGVGTPMPPSPVILSVPPTAGSVVINALISGGTYSNGSVKANPSGMTVGLPGNVLC